jgi:hypothetical protein
VNYASLFLAAVFGTPAVVLLLHHKAPRLVAVLAALAALCILAGVPSVLAALGHPLPPGPILLGITICALASATFVYLDVIRGHHKQPLMGRKAIGAATGAAGAGGGAGKRNHHVRPLVATVGLAVFGLMVFINFTAVSQAVGGGLGQTFSTISHHRGA